jgi:hypothetical protein
MIVEKKRQKPDRNLPVQALSAVRDWNFWLSACASLPFCALKPDPEADELAAALEPRA